MENFSVVVRSRAGFEHMSFAFLKEEEKKRWVSVAFRGAPLCVSRPVAPFLRGALKQSS